MQKENKKLDIRIIKTKKAIREATLRLLSQKKIEDISITELAIEAQINRKTFYNYYQSIYQVIEEIENEAVETFVSAIKSTDWYDGDTLDFYKLFLCVTEAVNENMEFCFYYNNITIDIAFHCENEIKVYELNIPVFLQYHLLQHQEERSILYLFH